MGQIVGVAATSHTFGTTEDAPETVERVSAGMAEIGRAIADSRPDVLVIASSDHLNNFTLDAQIALAVGIADEYQPLGDMGVPRTPLRGNREFGAGFAEFCAEVGFDLTPVENILPDHGIAFPNAFSNPDGRAALVPLYLNTVMSPTPSCARGYALGLALRRFVQTRRPEAERVAVIGSGGLSHWVCHPRSGEVNEAWDRRVIASMISGQGAELAGLTRSDILEEGGNGGLEIAAWAFAAGVAGNATGREIYYEPLTSWWTGMGGVLMNLDSELA
ncbi:Protocatechuate 4,5-dioxygenase beta chain [Pandoraea communis]|uniref:Protocatechuate 4,5-dioxygenase beta chain n=1 Tax=Pandoraea communis TaxID=2508297 RepID=A0A5E4VPA3_9BURK|nr:protocatechuate 3,4-dioxygenase [Pandoraea communis]VVE12835.1 Protocatechuate 4,5-dioxygenase beta chain [Pandoraea communis]